ncbi:MAG: hypothetical protein IPG89_08040 [Bacteroidetes bacterium]|nr:hypothetical protein [Bacteroidota bacterium]
MVVALFIGFTVSAEEISKDRRILKRGVFLNFSRSSSYLISKIGIMFILSRTECIVCVGWYYVMGVQGMG